MEWVPVVHFHVGSLHIYIDKNMELENNIAKFLLEF